MSRRQPIPASAARTFFVHLPPLLLYCGFVFFISSLSEPPVPDYGVEWGDKINHAGGYGLMMIAAWWAARGLPPGKSLRFQLIAALIFCSLYGASDELHQYFVPGRECDFFDWLADTAGAALAGGMIFLAYFYRTFFSHNKSKT